MIVSCSDFLYPSLAIKSLSDGFVSLDELIEFLGELFVLMSDNSDVVIQRIDFYLQV